MPPLSLKAIALSYQETFHVKEDESIKLAKATKGYAMAYQILDDILFRTKKVSLTQKVLQEYDFNLGQWSHEIIWSELTEKEKEILSLIADGICTNKNLQDHLNVNKGCPIHIQEKTVPRRSFKYFYSWKIRISSPKI